VIRSGWVAVGVLALAACASNDPNASSTSSTSATTAATTTTIAETTTTVAPTTTTTAPTFDSAAGLAAIVTDAERTIRDEAAPPDAVAAAGRQQQVAYRVLSLRPEWDAEVRAAVPPDLHYAFDRNLDARRAFVEQSAANTAPATPRLPAWSIVEPRPIDELRGYYDAASARTGVGWEYLAAINLQETRMGRVVGSSPAGAQGPMQFMPTTWAGCCTGDVYDPQDAIEGAADYLLLVGAPDDMRRALYGYNPSDTYVRIVTAYAEVLRENPLAYRGYHAWQVFVTAAVNGEATSIRLDVGYSAVAPIDATEYVTANPDAIP
jgi:hypothetical protein